MKTGDNSEVILNKLQEGKLKDAHFSKFSRDLILNLKDKQQDVITRRFGLSGRKKTTLDAIGKDFGVTRERVRQIESASLVKLKKLSKLEHNKPFFDKIHSAIEDNGGVINEEKMARALIADLEEKRIEEIKKTLRFILLLSSEIQRVEDTEHTNPGWALNKYTKELLEDLSKAYCEILEERKEVISDEVILTEILKHSVVNKYKREITKEFLGSSLDIAKNLHKVNDKRGLVTWPWVKPKTIRDKIFFVLSKSEKPMHFSDIYEVIGKEGFDNKKATLQTIHNELISDKRFVLVGRGLYALRDWGYEEGTVEDVIEKILRKSDTPMDQDDIVDEVLKKKHVKKATILINLQNSKRFTKEGGKYAILK